MTKHSDLLENPHINMHRITSGWLEHIRGNWIGMVGEDEFQTLYGTIFEGIEEDLGKFGFNVPVHAFIYDPKLYEQDIFLVDAIVELTDTKAGKMTKALSVRLAPKYIGWEGDTDMRQQVVDVYSRVILHIITLGLERANEEEHVVKIYGRNDPMLLMLQELTNKWGELTDNLTRVDTTARMEGRWINVSFTPKP